MMKRKRKDTTLDDDCDEDNNAPISVDRNHIFFYCDVNTKNCLELKGFERRFFSASAIKKIKKKEDREMTPEEYIEKPRFY